MGGTASLGKAAREEWLVELSSVQLCVSARRERVGRPLLLLAGLGMQLVGWPGGFISALERADFDVITYDHRDVGRSSFFDEAGPPDLLRALRHDQSRLAYGLEALAHDALELLTALGIDRANLFGLSMGAMVAQLAALEQPQRIVSLSSVMGSTGDRRVGQASNAALSVLLRPPAQNEEQAIAQRLAQFVVTSGADEVPDIEIERARATVAYERSHHPVGTARQLAALLAANDRTDALRSLEVPTLVIHGTDDQMIDPSGGRATAEAIPGARLLMLAGMGHDLPRRFWEEIVVAVCDNAARGAP